MAPSLTSRPGRGLNLPTTRDISLKNADEEKGDQLIKSTFDLLEKGEEEIRFDDNHRDVILILGNTGSGKSTFTQWIAGDNTKLISRETEEGSGDYIIEDHNRIGNNTLKSKTIFPELVIDPKTNAAYYDCPGFSDTQGTSHDIAETYFIKKVLDYSESVKLVFTISHPSLRKGVDRQDFMKLVRHATDLVKDTEKFKHGIAIVATKVDNQYKKQGKNFVLVEDDKVITAIAGFLQEAKQYLEDDSKRPNISEKEKRFYENATKFVDVLLEKEGVKYPRIGIFRRPDMPGPVSEIPLLQKGKEDIEKIVYEKLNFTAKNNEDFGYTVSEKTKNDIIEIVEEINKNLWSSLKTIAGSIQEHYGILAEQLRNKINLFVSDVNTVDVDPSEAETFRQKFKSGYLMTSEVANKLKNLTNPEKLAVVVNSTISNLNINVSEEDILYIANQGKYVSFLQTVSDKVLNSKPWYELFEDVEMKLSDLKTSMLHDADSAVEKINNRIQLNLNNTVKDMKDEYTEKIKFFEIQKLPEKLNKDRLIILELTKEMKNRTTSTENQEKGIRCIANNLGVSFPKENLQNVANQGIYLKFLEGIKDETLDVESKTLLSPLEDMAEYFHDSGKWYSFLVDLYNKLSEYDIQKDRQRFNVANLEDWGLSGKPQGIFVTPKIFERFLNKIENYNVTEYENIKNLSTISDLQTEELNQILSLTLKHRPTVTCTEPYVVVQGSFISLNETMQNLMGNSDTNNDCKNFDARLQAGKYKLFKFLALNKVFVDTDLPFSGKGISVAIIAPKWEVVGSRSIDLSGADGVIPAEPKAKTGAQPGRNGVNGARGNPGAVGESFLGIGGTFDGGSNLKIVSNGGKGGRGQDGGDGATGEPGRDGLTPEVNDSPCENGYFKDFKCEKVIGAAILTFSANSFKIHGLPGGRGGNGGNGGIGGKGADSGNIVILALNQTSDITKLTTKGKEGDIGKAGAGGQGGKNGDDIVSEFVRLEPLGIGTIACWFVKCVFTAWNYLGKIPNNGRGPVGSNGVDGRNTVGPQNPVSANVIQRLDSIINEYKIFLREHLSNRFEKHSLLKFLDQLNGSNDVKKLYDALALIEEFQGLEEQFHKLSDQMDFSPFYNSLLDRISEFAKSQKDGPDSAENKKVLNYLYTAALGRLYDLKENSESNLIIDIRGYLNLIKENIKALKDEETQINRVYVINKYKENYKSGIDKKIEEARSLIKKQISPEIENVTSNIDDKINILIKETIILQQKAEKDYAILAEKKKELGNAMALKGLFNILHIIGGVVSFLGPIGAVAGTVIEVTTTVAESLTLNKQQQDLNLPADVVSAIANIGDQIKEMRNKKVAYLNKLLNNVEEEIKKNPEKLSDMTGKIDDIKDKLKKASEKKMNFKEIKRLESELKGELKRKSEDLKINLGDKKSATALKSVEKITKIVNLGSLLLNVYDQMKEDNEKMDAVTDAMGIIEDKIRKLKEYEENIYDTIEPMLQEMEDHMKDIGDKLESKSHVVLDVTKFQVQSTLKDMRLQMETLTEGFNVKNDFSRSIEKLEEVMTILINIYDRIQSYQDQQNLANYIADISSAAASSIKVGNQLGNAFKYLEYSISANIVLKQYKSAIDAFKQWVFPFADHYIEKTMLPSQLQLDTSIQNLVQNAIREIETIKQKLDLYYASVKNGDRYLMCEEFSSRYATSQPFYVWKNEDYKSSISNLLSGKEVILKADIKESVPHKDAIKFSEIDFDFKLKNETTQSLLYEILENFDISATHLGNSYYRYANKITLITSDSVTISYSYEKNGDGIPIRANEVYNKLLSGDLLLSPYTFWEVRLINQTNQYSFKDLENYKHEINVELSGFGRYVNTNVFTPAMHKSLIVHDKTKPLALEYKATGVNQCRRSRYRFVRSPEEILLDGDYMTNSAPEGLSSPIKFLSTFLQTYLISNAITPLIKIFSREQVSVINYEDFSELLHEHTKTENVGEKVAQNVAITNTEKVIKTSVKDNRNKEGIETKSDHIFNANFDGNSGSSKSFLLSDQKDISTNHSTQTPDLNCSLLLADLITRTITGNKYKSPVDKCLLSPQEVILGKISDRGVRSESDIKQMLQRHLSGKEELSNSVFSKLKSYTKSMFQFLGLVGNENTEEYVEDVRNLFA